jgi:hypothetical protein
MQYKYAHAMLTHSSTRRCPEILKEQPYSYKTTSLLSPLLPSISFPQVPRDSQGAALLLQDGHVGSRLRAV